MQVVHSKQSNFNGTEEEEDEEEVLFREKADDDGEDEGVISDYESEAEISEEMVLEKLDKFLLLRATKTLTDYVLTFVALVL